MTGLFILVVLVAGSPPHSRGEFTSFERCTEAAVGEVETLRAIEPTVRWQCVPSPAPR
jgi:hypothetical protein